jgi:hypothetical protein
VKVLVACEYSGRVRDAFTGLGHDAVSCDLLPSDTPGAHMQCDVREALQLRWDLVVAFPPCTHLSKVGARYWSQWQASGQQEQALRLVRDLLDCDAPRVCVENPVGRISTAIRRPDQIIQPYEHGDPWQKATCLWLRNLPKLTPTALVEPRGRWVDGGTYSGTGGKGSAPNYEGSYSEATTKGNGSRAHNRSKTFPGIACAMASQWG